MNYKVKLTYFKLHGKYYTEGEYETDWFYKADSDLEFGLGLSVKDGGRADDAKGPNLHQIWAQVRYMRRNGKLPDVHGREWHITVDVPGHPSEHPALLLHDGRN